jgi:hypothetical protein
VLSAYAAAAVCPNWIYFASEFRGQSAVMNAARRSSDQPVLVETLTIPAEMTMFQEVESSVPRRDRQRRRRHHGAT